MRRFITFHLVAACSGRSGSGVTYRSARQRIRDALRPRGSQAIPVRRFSMVDFIRAAPGASPSSPGSVSTNSLSAFGSGTNENMFLIDGTNFTCPRSGEARSELLQSFHDEHRVGRARRTVCFRSSGRPEHGQRDDSEPVRSRDGCLQRRAADIRRTHAHSHDRHRHDQPLPAGAVGH